MHSIIKMRKIMEDRYKNVKFQSKTKILKIMESIKKDYYIRCGGGVYVNRSFIKK